jgi:hypothetical protein
MTEQQKVKISETLKKTNQLKKQNGQNTNE